MSYAVLMMKVCCSRALRTDATREIVVVFFGVLGLVFDPA
jgi:hypothetical protein